VGTGRGKKKVRDVPIQPIQPKRVKKKSNHPANGSTTFPTSNKENNKLKNKCEIKKGTKGTPAHPAQNVKKTQNRDKE